MVNSMLTQSQQRFAQHSNGVRSHRAANKHRAFWAHMRQNMTLLNNSDYKHDSQLIDAVNSELADILDQGIIIYPSTLLKLGLDAYLTLDQRKSMLGISNNRRFYTERERMFLETMQTKAENGRKHNWQWRISQEAEEKQKAGWYPFFITLTVDPNHGRFNPTHQQHRKGVISPKTLWENGREFRLFIRSLVDIVCFELGHPPARHKTKEFPHYRPESNYVTYAGVVEHGSSREHHHMHLLVWMREVPDAWKQCPNRWIQTPENRKFNECVQMRTLWPWSLPGLSKFNYYRTVADVWCSEGFCVPIDPKTDQPMRIAPAHVAGRYITKYLQKEHKEWHHRMKATRNLGLVKLKRKIQQMNPKTVEVLTKRPENSQALHSLSLIHSAPLGLVRFIAKQTHYYNQYIAKALDWKTQMRNSSDAFTKMLKSVRAGVRPDRMHSLQFFDWVSQHLEDETASYNELSEAHRLLSGLFPRNVIKTERTPLPGANIGITQSI